MPEIRTFRTTEKRQIQIPGKGMICLEIPMANCLLIPKILMASRLQISHPIPISTAGLWNGAMTKSVTGMSVTGKTVL